MILTLVSLSFLSVRVMSLCCYRSPRYERFAVLLVFNIPRASWGIQEPSSSLVFIVINDDPLLEYFVNWVCHQID